MTEIISAVYERGLLRPLTPLHLAEHQAVRIRIWPEGTLDTVNDMIEDLMMSGAVTAPIGQSSVQPPTDDERRELAAALGQGSAKMASTMIIEDRDA